MAQKPQGIAGLNVGDTNTLLNQMGKPKSLGDLAELYKQGILGQGPLKSKFVPPVGRFKTAPGQSTGMGYLKDIANFGLSGVDLFNQGIGAISAVTNPSGNLIGDYLSQEDPDSFEKRKNRVSDNFSGPEVFLPDENRNIYGAFSPEGQKRLFGQGELAEEENAIAGESDTGSDELQKRLSKIIESTDVSEEEKGIAGELTSEDVGGTGETIEGADTNAKKATVSALNDFLKEARPGVNPKTFDEYINEFGEATGLDISGEADTKQALMSFGLALMQNRAGKGFDISKILTATGEAGEAAMPDFRKATAEAKSVRAKAGAYALSKKESDQKKAMNRKAYFVIPKGDGSASSLSNMIVGGKGRLTRLNSYELNNLDSNSKFNEQFEIVSADYYKDYAKAALTASGKKKFYLDKVAKEPLFNGSDITIGVQYANSNFAPAGTKPNLVSDPSNALGAIERMEQGLARGEKQFKDIAVLLEQTKDITIPSQAKTFVVQLSRNLGITVDDKVPPITQLKSLLTELSARNAAEILGESGKTLSDNDRKMVKDIVGDINFASGDISQLKNKLGRLYSAIITSRRNDIDQAYNTLGNAGIKINRGGKGVSGYAYEKFEDKDGFVYRRRTSDT